MPTVSRVRLPHGPGKAHCSDDCSARFGDEEQNDPQTEALRRAIYSTLSYGSVGFLARQARLCVSSTQKQVLGKQRMCGSLIRAALLLRSREEIRELLEMWLGQPLAAPLRDGADPNQLPLFDGGVR